MFKNLYLVNYPYQEPPAHTFNDINCYLLISIQTLYISIIVLHTYSYITLGLLVIIYRERFHRKIGFSVSQFTPVVVPVPDPVPFPDSRFPGFPYAR